MALTRGEKLILSILGRHNRYTRLVRSVKCDKVYGRFSTNLPVADQFGGRCKNIAKWSFVPLTAQEPWDGVGTRGKYCDAHMLSHVFNARREYIALTGWLVEQPDYVAGIAKLERKPFKKVYPRRVVRLRKTKDPIFYHEGNEVAFGSPRWEIIHFRRPDTGGVVVSYKDDLDEAMRVARFFQR